MFVACAHLDIFISLRHSEGNGIQLIVNLFPLRGINHPGTPSVKSSHFHSRIMPRVAAGSKSLTSSFRPLVSSHRNHALPTLVDDPSPPINGALDSRSISCNLPPLETQGTFYPSLSFVVTTSENEITRDSRINFSFNLLD